MTTETTISTNIDPDRLAWGLHDIPQGDYLAAWGARAIFEDGEIFFLPDRQDSLGDMGHREIICDWLNDKALKELHKKFKADHWNGSTEDVFEYKNNFCTMYASPRGSHGYMYLTVVLHGTKIIPNGKWSNKKAIPAVWTNVKSKINDIGKCKVVGYCTQADWICLICKPFDPPAWYVQHNGKNALCGLYGAEIE